LQFKKTTQQFSSERCVTDCASGTV